MPANQKILYVLNQEEGSHTSLSQALSYAEKSGGEIDILIMYPAFPETFKDKLEAYRSHVLQSIQPLLDSAKNVKCRILDDEPKPHALSIIKHVVKNGHNLVIKSAESLRSGREKGLKAYDMTLLRKCPCAVWLVRDVDHAPSQNVLICVDPINQEDGDENLSLRLLAEGEAIAKSLSANVKILSCWDFEYEDFLRHSALAKTDDTEIDRQIADADKKHKVALEDLIKKANVSNDIEIERLRGKADDVIPNYVEENKVNLIVMGTVARTGIPGFFIGNTAENIFLNVGCALYTAKPDGYVSPIQVK